VSIAHAGAEGALPTKSVTFKAGSQVLATAEQRRSSRPASMSQVRIFLSAPHTTTVAAAEQTFTIGRRVGRGHAPVLFLFLRHRIPV
jgi:hypothetical protein